jgi:hypothetical protein
MPAGPSTLKRNGSSFLPAHRCVTSDTCMAVAVVGVNAFGKMRATSPVAETFQSVTRPGCETWKQIDTVSPIVSELRSVETCTLTTRLALWGIGTRVRVSETWA